jgi:hypothetical protein
LLGRPEPRFDPQAARMLLATPRFAARCFSVRVHASASASPMRSPSGPRM